MRVLHKYNLNIGQTDIHLPRSAKPLLVAEQYGQLQMWVEVNVSEETILRHFRVFTTGETLESFLGMEVVHIGTAVMEGGNYIAHVYEGVVDE